VRSVFRPSVSGFVACLVCTALPVWPGRSQESSVPSFSGVWARSTFGWELRSTGPGPLKNLKRRPNGTSDQQTLVGDYTSPILKPGAAEIVKEHGETSLAGQAFPDPSNQCATMAPPYILRINEMEMVQQPHMVTILYMNDSHPKEVVPSWHGDSVAHYEGDTLVVDTVGIKVGPASMVDMYGTPHSEQLHVVERYRMVDGDVAKASSALNDKEYGRADGPAADGVFVDYQYKGKGLQVQFTVEDPLMFTTPWSGSVTYLRAANDWEERVCAENIFEYYSGKDTGVPHADKPDF
jgi:hypothetical protein